MATLKPEDKDRIISSAEVRVIRMEQKMHGRMEFGLQEALPGLKYSVGLLIDGVQVRSVGASGVING